MEPPHPPPFPIPLTTLPSHECNYLPGRIATSRAFRIDRMPAEVYHQFMDAGFRRSGTVIYQPICESCRECVPIRIRVGDFKPDKSQRRCARRNSDLSVTDSLPLLTEEKVELYQRYMTDWHKQKDVSGSDENSLRSFLYESPVDSREFCYRLKDGTLVAVGIADISAHSFSSVYFYFDPRERYRGLGTFGALHELNWARRSEIPYYYLGYWITGCRKMQYKSNSNPQNY